MKYIFALLLITVFFSAEAQFLGGKGDGYASKKEQNSTNIYLGGQEDGFDHSLQSGLTSIYYGGTDDGYDHQSLASSSSVYSGGDDDGYAVSDNIAELIWTGAVGTGWNIDGNWNLGFYPRLRHNAIIPAGLTNYPKVNGGLLTINRNLNGGIYFCKGIYLAAGAEMTLKISTTLENYGLVNIYGNFISLSTLPEAVKVITPGKFNIRNGGSFIW